MLVRPAETETPLRGLLESLPLARRPEVVVAGSGEEALELAARASFDVAVADLLLPKPGLSGATTLIRFRETNPGARTVLLSGHDYVRPLVRRAADEVLVGPQQTDPRQLRHAVTGHRPVPEVSDDSGGVESAEPLPRRASDAGGGAWSRLRSWLRGR